MIEPASAPLIAFTINGQVSGGKNQIGTTAAGHRYPMSEKFKSWRSQAVQQIRRQYPPGWSPVFTPDGCQNPLISVHVKMLVRYTRGDERRRDVPALLDGIFHVLERQGIVKDDALITEIDWKDLPISRARPGIEVELWATERR